MEIHSDVQGIRLALELAAKGMFTTTPNPRVGCVIVKENKVIGSGYTQPVGHAHAEVQALNDAADRGFDVAGATVYVTCLLYTSPSPRDRQKSRMPSSA